VTPVDSGEAAFLEALRTTVTSARAALEACAEGTEDRWRFAVDVGLDGTITRATSKDAHTPPSAPCAAKALGGLAVARPRTRPIQAEVTIYLKPSFKVAAF